MESLIENPNLAVDIGQKILNCLHPVLDINSIKSCRLVNSSMKKIVDDPQNWIQKLAKPWNKLGLSQEHLKKWRTLIALVKNTDLEANVVKCLMKMYHQIMMGMKLSHQNPKYFGPKMKKYFDEWSQAPIYIASKIGDARLVEMILKHAGDLWNPMQLASNGNGETPIHCAAKNGHYEVSKLLMSFTESFNANIQDNRGQTPLHWAAAFGHYEVLRFLISRTTNPNPQCHHGTTPIWHAVCYNHLEIVKLLVPVSDNPNVPPNPNNGWTPIHVAATKGYLKIAKVLIPATEFPNAQAISGITPRRVAIKKLHFRIASLLGPLSLSDFFVCITLALIAIFLPFLLYYVTFHNWAFTFEVSILDLFCSSFFCLYAGVVLLVFGSCIYVLEE